MVAGVPTGWIKRSGGAPGGIPRKAEEIILPLLEAELRISPENYTGDNVHFSEIDFRIVQAAFTEAAKLEFVNSPHSSALSKRLLGGRGLDSPLISLIAEREGGPVLHVASVNRAKEVVHKLTTELTAGLGFGHSIA